MLFSRRNDRRRTAAVVVRWVLCCKLYKHRKYYLYSTSTPVT
ncbi:unnamed protein product [Haemonchus placei]|uniref:Uncharacterized protein n=1 Tax=Haemonchus placei TaxID=6290 RepID=A0A0N4WIS7_HAEPC|nr:unnamed protein product [Haemonchus placei]